MDEYEEIKSLCLSFYMHSRSKYSKQVKGYVVKINKHSCGIRLLGLKSPCSANEPWTSPLTAPFRSFLIWQMETTKAPTCGSF